MTIRWRWIVDRRTDLSWFIGSALFGWAYLGLVAAAGRGLRDPLRDPFFTLAIGPWSMPLTLGLLVLASWAILFDAPHLWGTLARTFLDPDEWATRRQVLLLSLAWFGLGPALLLAPHVAAAFLPVPPRLLGAGSQLFWVFFRLWAYYHVVRQHWGFVALYKRKNEDGADPAEDRSDRWFFTLVMYLPLLLYLSAPWSPDDPLGLRRPLAAGIAAADLIHPAALALYPATLLAYAAHQVARAWRGAAVNGPKLLLLIAVAPLHLVAFTSPLLSLFLVPVVTVGHNLQYHRIVWMYGRNKYLLRPERRHRWLVAIFRRPWLYVVLGLVFTFACYRGPWIDLVQSRLGAALGDWLYGGLGLLTGLNRPASASLGSEAVALLLLGWAMQHYYLDARIWRLRRDPQVARALEVG